MTVSLESLGPRVAAKRGGLSLRDAAEEAGMSKATFARIERGGVPDLVNFARICRWLEADPREFLGTDTDQDAMADA